MPSLGTGQVVTFAPGATTPTTFIAAGDPEGVSGLFVAASDVWLCAVDLSVQPPATEVRKYSLAGAKLASYAFSQPAFCNDLIEDATGNLFVSDSFGAVWKLPAGGDALALWKSDAALAPPTASGFGADGLALDGAGNLYVTNFSAATLLRIAIGSDGNATTSPRSPHRRHLQTRHAASSHAGSRSASRSASWMIDFSFAASVGLTRC